MLEKAYKYLSDLLLHHGRNRLPLWSAGKTANLCASREALAAGSRSRTSATLSVQKGLFPGSQNRFEPPTDTAQWSQIYKFLAQADAIKILMRGFLDFLRMLDFRPRFLNIRIARELLQQCPFLFVSRLLLWFASD